MEPTKETSEPPPKGKKGRKETEVSQEDRTEIAQLHLLGYGARKIAARTGLGRKIIRRVLREEGYSAPSLPDARASKLDPFREAIQDKVAKHLTTKRILRELREIGYEGQRTILADFVRTMRAQAGLAPKKKVKRRFETRIGLETQIDWSPYWVKIAGQPVKIHVFGALLCHSRKLFVAPYEDERESTMLEALASSFEYFDGVTTRVVLDRMATAVLGRIGPDGEPIWHPRFAEFKTYYGFEPFLCAVGDSDRKGKKEKSFRLVWDDCLNGIDFDSWEHLRDHIRKWLDHKADTGNQRIHGTTGLRPNEAYLVERDFLIRLPGHRFPVYDTDVRIVYADATISVKSIKYTVPANLANSTVAVRLFAEHFEVVDRYDRTAFARRYIDKTVDERKLIIDPTHYVDLPRRPAGKGCGPYIDELFVQRFPSLAPLAQGLKLRFKGIANIHFTHLVRLAGQYEEPDFIDAATRAQAARNFNAHAVERILQQEHPLSPEDTCAPLGGLGAAILGEVEEATLDAFAHLDHDPATQTEDSNNEEED